MFLKRFKEKSNQKYMNQLLAARKVFVNNNKVSSIGVILNSEEFADLDAFENFFKQVGLKDNKTKIISYAHPPTSVKNYQIIIRDILNVRFVFFT